MLLSIIIPVYNAEKFIERCISSIEFNQIGIDNDNDIEIIVINDGSIDNSGDIIKKLMIKNHLIKYFEQNNLGEGYTRNVGLKKASGKYIWFIDADDYIENSLLNEILIKLVNYNGDIDAICFGHVTVSIDRKIISRKKLSNSSLSPEKLIQNGFFTNTVWSKVIKSELIENNKIKFNPAVKTATDFDFSFRVLFNCKNIITLENNGYFYVVHPNSISNIRSKEHLERLANDSIEVGNSVKEFLLISEDKNKVFIFKFWLNNYWYGLHLSLLRFDYSINFIKNKIKQLRNNNIYPMEVYEFNLKKRIFLFFANNEKLFLALCKLKRIKQFHE